MSLKIGVVQQKGGVGKSTLARAIATTYATAGWDVKIADLDINQSTSYQWHKRRLSSGIEPVVAVEVFGSVSQALKQSDNYDLFVFDGAPHATRATLDISNTSDLVVIPTGLSLDDMEPAVILANDLVKNGVQPSKIALAFCRIGESEREFEEAKDYLSQTNYHILDGFMQEKTAFRRASDQGKAATESQYKGPKNQADNLIQSVINRIKELKN